MIFDIHVCICIYVYMYKYSYVYTYVYTYIHFHIYAYRYAYVCTYMNANERATGRDETLDIMQISICITCLHIFIHMYICI